MSKKEDVVVCEHCRYYYWKDFVANRNKTTREIKENKILLNELRTQSINNNQHYIIPFGKHKGHRLDKLPKDYLIWLSEQKWFLITEDTKIYKFIHTSNIMFSGTKREFINKYSNIKNNKIKISKGSVYKIINEKGKVIKGWEFISYEIPKYNNKIIK